MKPKEFEPVPESSWSEFTERFTEEHHGWLVTLAELDTALFESERLIAYAASMIFEEESPLESVRMSENGTHDCVLNIGDERPMAYHIDDVQQMYVCQNEAGTHQGLRLDASDNRTLLMQFTANSSRGTASI